MFQKIKRKLKRRDSAASRSPALSFSDSLCETASGKRSFHNTTSLRTFIFDDSSSSTSSDYPKLDMSIFNAPLDEVAASQRHFTDTVKRSRSVSDGNLIFNISPGRKSSEFFRQNAINVSKKGRFTITVEKSAHSSPGQQRWANIHEGQSRFHLVPNKSTQKQLPRKFSMDIIKSRSCSIDSGVEVK